MEQNKEISLIGFSNFETAKDFFYKQRMINEITVPLKTRIRENDICIRSLLKNIKLKTGTINLEISTPAVLRICLVKLNQISFVPVTVITAYITNKNK